MKHYLKPADLVQYIGSKSKVSEILNRKRPLSMTMVRKLHSGLGIPAEVLLQESKPLPQVVFGHIDWREFPLSEMLKRVVLHLQGDGCIRRLLQAASVRASLIVKGAG